MAIEFDGLEAVINDLEKVADLGRVEAAIKNATLKLHREAAIKAPKGEIQQSIDFKVEGLTGKVFTPNKKAPYVEYGTGKFSTHPMGGRKELPWVYVEGESNEPSQKTIHTEQSADEAVAFLRSQGLPAVKTYGSKPQPFMRPALDENKEEIIRILGEALIND